MAAPYQGEVRLFHVVGPSIDRAPATDSERLLERLFALGRHLPGRPRISAAVTEGDAAAEILRHARMVQADLIAIGMHAQDGGVSPLIARLAIDAPCPVLVVDDALTLATTPGRLDRILVAINFLPASLAAAQYALALAKNVAARVTAIHVLPEHWDGPPRDDANVDDTRRVIEHHFRELLHFALTEMSGSSRDRSEVVVSGRTCVEIVRAAAAYDADMVVMGIDASKPSPKEFGETTSCVMQFVGRTVLLVPDRLFRSRRPSRPDRRNRLH